MTNVAMERKLDAGNPHISRLCNMCIGKSVLALVVMSVGSAALAATWTGEAGDNKWNTPGNWADGRVPGGQSNLAFNDVNSPLAMTNDIENGYKAWNVDFSGTGPVVIDGNPLSLYGTRLRIRQSPMTVNVPVTFYCEGNDFKLWHALNETTRFTQPVSFTKTGTLTIGSWSSDSVADPGTVQGSSRAQLYFNGLDAVSGTVKISGYFDAHFTGPLKTKMLDVGGGFFARSFVFESTGNHVGLFRGWNTRGIFMTVENAFDDQTVLSFPEETGDPVKGPNDNHGYLGDDLGHSFFMGGFNQQANRLFSGANMHRGNSAAGRDNTMNVFAGSSVDGEQPSVVLTLKGSADSECYMRLCTGITLVWDPVGDYTQTFVNRTHTMTGDLIVKGGTLESSGTNRFVSVKNVRIASGAVLKVSSSSLGPATNPFPNNPVAYVEGRVNVPAGVTVTFDAVYRDGTYLKAKTYQGPDGADPQAEKVSWISGNGLVAVTGQRASYWCGPASGKWNDPENWTGGIPTGTKSVVIDAQGTATYEISLSTGDVLPAGLLLKGCGTTLVVPDQVSVAYAGAGQQADWRILDGARVLVNGGTLSLNGFNGSFEVASSVAVTSKVEIATGTLRFEPANASSAMILKNGGAVEVVDGVLQTPLDNRYPTFTLAGGSVWASGTANVEIPLPRNSFGSGDVVFAGNSVLGGSGNGKVVWAPANPGERLSVSFRDHAQFVTQPEGLTVGSKDTVSTVDFASSAVHASLGYSLTTAASGSGCAEIRVSDGWVGVGERGISIAALSTGNLTDPLDGRLAVSGGALATIAKNGGWTDQKRPNGVVIGYAANVPWREGHPVQGTMNITGGVVTNENGVTLIGTGLASGSYVQDGGFYLHRNETQVFGVGQAGGIGTFVLSNGTVNVASSVYVGGFWTNLLTKAENCAWPVDWHGAVGTMSFVGGKLSVAKDLVLGADGRGTLVREGTAGTFEVGGDLVLSNNVADVTSGGTLQFDYVGKDGIAPLLVGGRLVIREGAKIVVNLGDYGTQKVFRGRRYLVKANGGIVGDLLSAEVVVNGTYATRALVQTDATGLYASLPRGLVIQFR